MPLVMALPPGVGAVDFYIDLAIDCVETVNVTKACQVTSAVPCLSCTLPKRHALSVKPENTTRQLSLLDAAPGSLQSGACIGTLPILTSKSLSCVAHPRECAVRYVLHHELTNVKCWCVGSGSLPSCCQMQG